ncbi:hypothetical protein V8F06_000574 [Rhypophila decipiens]
MKVSNIFAKPIGTDHPPAQIPQRQDHPAPRTGIKGTGPFATNKFYCNFYLGNQASATYLFPYSVTWAGGKGSSSSWGLAISHVPAEQRVFGNPSEATGAARYYISPVGIQSVSISAKELGPGTVLTTDNLTDTSVRVNLSPDGQGEPTIRFPLVQGSAFVTAEFHGGTPLIQTGIYFQTVTRSTQDPKPGVTKYKLHLNDDSVWRLYAYHTQGDALELDVVNHGLAQSTKPFYGIIQVAKDPGNGEALYDAASGAYPTGTQLSGSVNGKTGTYTFTFDKAGMKNSTLAMYALPHHVASFDDGTRGKTTDVQLDTTTKGIATAVLANSWTMVEDSLPVDIGFLPWVPNVGSVSALSPDTRTVIHNIARQEISQNMLQQSNQDSMYFSGKALAKFAQIVLAVHDILGDRTLARSGLEQLKIAFARFSENKQQYPLVYETAWGGVVSSASFQTGDAGVDFGNSYYNDHHFHYGYFILTAAVIGHLDHGWIAENKDYVNMLVRDVANPSTEDKHFPVFRAFDWYHGHSWAHGLFESADGKDQESSSEDTMHTYALKMWGTVSGDADLAARSNLMLAVQTRALQAYYLYTKDNTVQPAEFIGNKAAGILFENKIDHVTYFGTNIEYIQGIHMMPLLPHTPMVRTPEFVREEWETYFSNGRAEAVDGGWRGVLLANYATIDPRGAYAFFSQPDFDPGWLDGGASLTWYLCYSAGEFLDLPLLFGLPPFLSGEALVQP